MTTRLSVILVNWNRWQDSVECLESLLRSTVPLKIILVDNASSDGSISHIHAWAEGHEIVIPANVNMAHFSDPPSPKPIPLINLSTADIDKSQSSSSNSDHQILLIASNRNLGFAGGNNIGIRCAVNDPDIQYFWLLNNDTVVAPETAEHLLNELDATPDAGQCGTMVCYYHQPDRVQALGGSRFQPLTGRSWGLGMGSDASAPINPASITRQMDFVLGASLAISREFIGRVGLMEESYFLYFEEIDWATRNRRMVDGPLATSFAAKAVVWHKEGGSIGSSTKKGQSSKLSDYWLNRSRLKFTAHYYPLLLPFHYLLTVGYIVRHLLQGRSGHAANLMRALFRLSFSA